MRASMMARPPISFHVGTDEELAGEAEGEKEGKTGGGG